MATNFAAVLMILTLPVSLEGCAAVGLTLFGVGAGVATGTGVDYTLNGIAERTYAASTNDVHVAARNALKHMAMPIITDKATDSGWEIVAQAGDREIEVDVERLTPNTTRLRVVANRHSVFKDRATATEIIAQTDLAVDNRLALKSAKNVTRR